jgi:hypothetical protein
MPCPRCDLEHDAAVECVRALTDALRLACFEIRELRSRVDHLSAERAREAAWRTLGPSADPSLP